MCLLTWACSTQLGLLGFLAKQFKIINCFSLEKKKNNKSQEFSAIKKKWNICIPVPCQFQCLLPGSPSNSLENLVSVSCCQFDRGKCWDSWSWDVLERTVGDEPEESPVPLTPSSLPTAQWLLMLTRGGISDCSPQAPHISRDTPPAIQSATLPSRVPSNYARSPKLGCSEGWWTSLWSCTLISLLARSTSQFGSCWHGQPAWGQMWAVHEPCSSCPGPAMSIH